ncbi:hypothetical protein FEM03_15400 [Phragmitibacter flavus]|uniref:Uncharacterized protein n=1 Tax=Phragmitibacter flavus TaxID=2576071 RepID=A0A5R8KBM1_9BACT|nr:hypothetical protein [Phragmitibacter flavus]TLD69712.1 hypothetical protein FEM03_15400 [Phragmitibacter flavus]
MAKRKSDGDGALNLDSLMDTVTNVVGVLMIVLIMVSLNIAVSIEKILSELPPVTVEQFEALKEELVKEKPQLDPKKLEEEMLLTKDNLKKSDEELKTLDTTDESQVTKMVDIDELRAQLEKNTKVRDERKVVIENMLEELEKTKALLDTTPVYIPPAATVVKLPNPRPIPENALIQRFLVVGTKVVYLNDEEFYRVITDGIEKQKKSLMFEGQIKDLFGEVIMAGGKPKEFVDRRKLAAFFADRMRLSTRDLKVELTGTPNGSRLSMKLSMQPGGGEDVATMKQPGSVFQRAMRKFGSEPNTVVWFYVFKDAIPTYLAAREIADSANAACAWELTNNDFYQRQLTTFEVDFVPAKPPPPPPPGQIRIPAPKTGLD